MAPAQGDRLKDALVRAIGLLRRLDIRFALVGGLAVSARAEPRFTRDIDLAVAVQNDSEAERLIFKLQQEGLKVLAAVEQEAVGRLATARISVPVEGGVVCDLLFASSGIEAEVVAEAEPLELVENLTVPVATLPHLIALKVLAKDDRRRPQDRMDLLALLRVANEEDLARAREALTLIMTRGFHREKALIDELDAILAESKEA